MHECFDPSFIVWWDALWPRATFARIIECFMFAIRIYNWRSFFVKPKLQSAAPWQINLSLRMQNARNRSLNYIYNGVILPDQKFCRIVPRCFFSSLYLIFYLEILVIICARQKNYDSTSTRNFFDKHNCQITYLPTLFNFTQ